MRVVTLTISTPVSTAVTDTGSGEEGSAIILRRRALLGKKGKEKQAITIRK